MPPPNHHGRRRSPVGACATNMPHVHVHRRHVRIARMEHERHAHRLPRAIGELRARGRCGRRQPFAGDVRVVDAAALEDVAFLDHSRDAAAAFRPRPFVAAERSPVDRLEPGDDARLQSPEVVAGTVTFIADHGRRQPIAGRPKAVPRGGGDDVSVGRPPQPRARPRDDRCRCGTACRRTGFRRPPRTPRAAPASPNRRAP